MNRAGVIALVLAWSASARAEDAPLPSLPPPPPSPPPPVPAEVAPRVPPPEAVPPPAERSPAYAFWVGGRVGLLAYGGALYRDPVTNLPETTGNFVHPGFGVEIDVGARLARRYIPYAALELGLVAPGHRFDGTDAHAATYFLGVGIRYVAGDVDRVAFVGDVSVGERRFDVSRDGATWSAWGLEILRLGMGVDVRLARRLTLSPMVTLSGGSLGSTAGHVAFAPNQGDGQTGPAISGGASIPAGASYYVVAIGCGIHADLLGR